MALLAHAPSTVNKGGTACAMEAGLTHPYTRHRFDTFALALGFLPGFGRGHDQRGGDGCEASLDSEIVL
jgi:hypothetical protein